MPFNLDVASEVGHFAFLFVPDHSETTDMGSSFSLPPGDRPAVVRHLPTRPFNTGDGEMESEGDRQAHTRAHTHVHAHTQTLTHGSGVLGFLSWRLPALTVQLLCDVLIQSLWKNTGRCARVYTHPC